MSFIVKMIVIIVIMMKNKFAKGRSLEFKVE